MLTDNKYEENIHQLLEEIYEWRETDEVDLVRSNNGGWHSPTDIFRKQQPGLKRKKSKKPGCQRNPAFYWIEIQLRDRIIF